MFFPAKEIFVSLEYRKYFIYIYDKNHFFSFFRFSLFVTGYK
ncbi:hypothetical protein SAMN05192533_111123 [Mesobacillus persicus]|uniref:Uncharacterized protein n=1 Tax=Mesobacillus persicus TaxID=930146 RepID=A0A1H8FN06_9BACI|nr:hypothetical protein SAMN05192533_111123 [Mesobacillus persicus]